VHVLATTSRAAYAKSPARNLTFFFGTSVRVEARCTCGDGCNCYVDCNNLVQAAHGACVADSDAAGRVHFTDLMLLDEVAGQYSIDFKIFGDPSDGWQASLEMQLANGLSPLERNNYGLNPMFHMIGWGRREILAGDLYSADEGVEVELVNSIDIAIDHAKTAIVAQLVPHAPVINRNDTMYAAMMHACVTPAEYDSYCSELYPTAPDDCLASKAACDSPGFSTSYVKSPYPITCCQLGNCNEMQMPGAAADKCCDCSRPECTLCQVPGYVTTSNSKAMGRVNFMFGFRRVGTFKIGFKYKAYDEGKFREHCINADGHVDLSNSACVQRWTERYYIPETTITVKAVKD